MVERHNCTLCRMWQHTGFSSSHWGCSVRKGVLRNFAKFTGKHPCQSIFLNKVSGLRPVTLLKHRPCHVFPCEFWEISKNNLLAEHLWATGSWFYLTRSKRKPAFWHILHSARYPCRHVTRNFLGQGRFLGIRQRRKDWTTAQERKAPHGKNCRVFCLETLKNCNLNEKFYPQMTSIRAFFPKLGHFVPIFEKKQGRPPPPPPLVTRLPWWRSYSVAS